MQFKVSHSISCLKCNISLTTLDHMHLLPFEGTFKDGYVFLRSCIYQRYKK